MGEISVWNLEKSQQETILTGAGVADAGCIFLKEEICLLCVCFDGTTARWDGKALTRHAIKDKAFAPEGWFSKCLSLDGNLFAFVTEDHGWHITLWDLAGGKRRWLARHNPLPNSFAFSPTLRILASGSMNIKFWNIITGKEEAALKGHKAGIFSLAFSGDGKRLASGSESWKGGAFSGGEIKLWDVASRKELATVKAHGDTVNLLAFSPDGKTLASASYGEGVVILWNIP